jgi:ATP-dependent 26S proteasome regulatory subunit
MSQPDSSNKQSFSEQLRRLLATRCPIVFIQTYEEARLERILTELCGRMFSQPVPLYRWSATTGLTTEGAEPIPGSEDPTAALTAVIEHPRTAFFLFSDLHRHTHDARVVSRLRETYRALRANYKTLFLCASALDIPPECHKEVAVLTLSLPDVQQIDAIFAQVCRQHAKVEVNLEDQHDALLRGTLGLTEDEAHTAFAKLLLGKSTVGPEIIDTLYEEKREIVRKEGILDYVPSRVALEDIGGLGVLKYWLQQRQRFFMREAEEFGLDPPKGLLVTGISGCGKSMAVQAVASCWKMPLIRLDMNRVYAGISGSPERTLERAIHTAEAISPCVLWIDEIETAIVGTSGTSNLSTRIFSSFLTWMQEKEHMVFVAATANEIDKLPPELLRKGRFDEVFFVDLPNEKERQEILAVHLQKRGRDPNAFDLVSLAKSTNNYNGAEMEQIVLSALFAAFDENRDIDNKDLYRALGRMVPLATTMAERIKDIKRWADTRAIKANG